MLHFFILVYCLHFLRLCFAILLEANVQCKNNLNEPVNWWYLYKPPGEPALYDERDTNVSYIISDILERWITETPKKNMLQNTLSSLFRNMYSNRLAYLIFDGAESVGTFPGSVARGILLADLTGGIFISHTVPNYIDSLMNESPNLPETELYIGHLFVCIDMDLYNLNKLGMLVSQTGAKTISHVPRQMKKILPAWEDNPKNNRGNDGRGMTIPHFYSKVLVPGHVYQSNDILFAVLKEMDQLEFKTEALHGKVLYRHPGQDICLYRSFAHDHDIYLDVYAPVRNRKEKKNICGNNYGIRTINSISLKYHDHVVEYVHNRTDKTRFGVSTTAYWQEQGSSGTQYWTCTSSLDREDQTGKGGLLLCVNNLQIWTAFDNFKIREPECDEEINK